MTTYKKDSPQTIQAMFSSIAHQYDRANAILSFNRHKVWNRKLVELVTQFQKGHTLIDLCAGTGDISLAYLKECRGPSRVVMLDFCHEMLDKAAEKSTRFKNQGHTIEFVQGDAQCIPFADHFASCVTIAYGIRNVKNPAACIGEIHRVLKPGGRFGILELTRPSNPFMRFGHQVYTRTLLPVLGKLVTSNKDAYTYLCNSIRDFTPPEVLEEIIQKTGFKEIERLPLFGGVATIFTGRKH